MKRKLLGLALFLAASALYGQATITPVYLTLQPFAQGDAVDTGGGGSLSDGDKGEVTVSGSGTVWTIDDGVTVSGWTSMATDTFWDAVGDLALGSGANTGARLAVGVEGQQLGINSAGAVSWLGAGVSPTAGPCSPSRTVACFFEDFYVLGANVTGATRAPAGNMYSAGAATSGWSVVAAAVSATSNDGNHPGAAGLSTGTSSTSYGAAWGGMSGQLLAPTILLNGGEVFEAEIYNPMESAGSDLFKTWWGWGDVGSATAAPTNGLYFYWDEQVNTNVGCGAASASGGAPTETLSNFDMEGGTGGPWYNLRIEVNSDATSVAYKINGTELSCSPITGADIPKAAGETTAVEIRIGARSGCAAATTCYTILDYVYFFDPTITR